MTDNKTRRISYRVFNFFSIYSRTRMTHPRWACYQLTKTAPYHGGNNIIDNVWIMNCGYERRTTRTCCEIWLNDIEHVVARRRAVRRMSVAETPCTAESIVSRQAKITVFAPGRQQIQLHHTFARTTIYTCANCDDRNRYRSPSVCVSLGLSVSQSVSLSVCQSKNRKNADQTETDVLR